MCFKEQYALHFGLVYINGQLVLNEKVEVNQKKTNKKRSIALS